MTSKVILIFCLLLFKIYSQPSQQQCQQTFYLTMPNKVEKFVLNLRCHQMNFFCLAINRNVSSLILRVDFPPNKCISTKQDYPPTENNIWKLEINKTCCDIFGTKQKENVQIVAMARKGFVFGGFPIADDIFNTYPWVIGIVLIVSMIFVILEKQEKYLETQEEKREKIK